MHRFFISPSDLQKDQFHSTDKELCHQVSKVLKMRAGKKVILCDNLENELEAEWTTVSRSICEAKIIEKKIVDDISSKLPVHLYVSPLKNQNRWELILEKGTEIGIASFTPLISKRSEASELRKPERLQRIIKEAAEQSGRTKLPELNSPLQFDQLVEICTPGNALGFIATLHESTTPLSQAIEEEIKACPMSKIGLNIFIGPEGGFTEEEVEEIVKKSVRAVTLGSQTLRTETAAIVAGALALHQEN
jgi:16S rRNA (uracil1498-N3)-methyltransferase